MSHPSRLALLLSLILIGESVANDYDSSPRQSTVTSPPVHVSERNYQHQQQPSVLTQSYQVLPESRNYYQYPQYLPTHAGYSNIQTVGQPYQMYGSSSGSSSSSAVVSGGNSESYGYSAQSPIPTLAPAPVTVPERHRTYTPSPTPPSPFTDTRETQRGRAPGHQALSSSSQNQGRRFPALPQSSSFMIAPKPVLSYGAANPFLANLPPAQGVYGAPVDASHRGDAIRAFHELNPEITGYDGSSGAAPAPPSGSSASVDDTWEALEASLDANTRRRHRIF
ncbi:hypothetical protein B9Z55_018877 [Caenorhabditis nigoni]|uniref:Zasp-like motif domain-containing protein n=1 Tax=Caenorhabditis nigoni TaxID=1611254 RepID=A0A2G5TG62_9PELO|nr:hypothetical protein B9Z55_018877 [Caenorhabditis nigoni]